MPDHDTQQAGDDPTLTAPAPGTEPLADAPAEAHRGPRFSLGGFGVPKFGRKKAAPEASAAPSEGVDAPGYGLGPDPEARPARRMPKVAWHRLPLANARRETRVGAAALASFLILVVALLLNRGGTTKDARPGDLAAVGTRLALNNPDDPQGMDDPAPPKVDPKPRSDPEPKPSPKSTGQSPRPDETPIPPARAPVDPAPAKGGSEVVLLPSTQRHPDSSPARPRPTPADADAPALVPTGPARPVDTLPTLPPIAAAPATAPPLTDELPSMPTLPAASATAPDPLTALPLPAATPDPRDAPKPVVSTDPPSTPVAAPKPEPSKPAGGGSTSPAPVVSELPAPAPTPAPAASTPPPVDPFKMPETHPDPIPTPAPAAGPKPTDPPPKSDPIPAIEPVPVPVESKPVESPAPAAPAHPLTSAPAPEATPLSATDPAPAPTPAPARDLPKFEPDPAPMEGGRAVRNLGRKRMPDPEPEARLAPERAVADAPLPREDVGAREQVDPILHTVDSGENFWTISRTYYGSGRYYKALHYANRRAVPKIDELYVDTTIKVPPVESLDPRYIDPPSRSTSTDDSATRTSRSSTSGSTRAPRDTDDGRAVPSRSRGEFARSRPDPDEPTRPTYRVRANETLRGIARDTLGDPHRYKEILNLNRDAIDDPSHLTPGLSLTLPDDAVVRAR